MFSVLLDLHDLHVPGPHLQDSIVHSLQVRLRSTARTVSPYSPAVPGRPPPSSAGWRSSQTSQTGKGKKIFIYSTLILNCLKESGFVKVNMFSVELRSFNY